MGCWEQNGCFVLRRHAAWQHEGPCALGESPEMDLQAVPWQAVPLQPLTLGPAAMTASQFKWEQGWL